MQKPSQKIDVVLDKDQEEHAGTAIEGCSAYYYEESGRAEVYGEAVIKDPKRLGEYFEVEIICYASDGSSVGREYTNWSCAAPRQSFNQSIKIANAEPPSFVKVYPQSDKLSPAAEAGEIPATEGETMIPVQLDPASEAHIQFSLVGCSAFYKRSEDGHYDDDGDFVDGAGANIIVIGEAVSNDPKQYEVSFEVHAIAYDKSGSAVGQGKTDFWLDKLLSSPRRPFKIFLRIHGDQIPAEVRVYPAGEGRMEPGGSNAEKSPLEALDEVLGEIRRQQS